MGVPADAVDDAAQQVFWVLSQKLDSVVPGAERAFLFGTARGVAANARRSAHAHAREVADEALLHAQVDETPLADDLVQRKEARALLDRALERMADDLRVVFVLFVLEGTSTKEIGELLDLPPGTVASRLRRARDAFHAITRRLEASSARRGGSR
jgi:RNA polymerase sigma-70 factor (ECF subfamily)